MQEVRDYYRHARPEVLPFVPASARRILDVGCGSGVFGALLKDRLQAEVWGVEYHAESAGQARQVLDKVVCAGIEQALPDLPAAYFDCVVFNDCLEHLVDPFSVLRELPRCLSRDGVVVASIPNIRHWPEFVDLIVRGQWQYANQGVLDRTHLRFFTKKSIAATFSDCGYTVSRLEGINPYYSRAQKLANWLTLGALADTRYLQFAVVAQPIATQSMSAVSAQA